MSGSMNPNISGVNPNHQDSTGRPFASTFSGQPGSLPGFHHSGLHNMHGNLNLTNLSGSLAPRNASLNGIPSPGGQQTGVSISGGRFPSNNLPASMSQIPHGHSGIINRGASPALGNLGPRIPNSVGNIVGASNIGRSISSAGLSMPSIASRMNLSGNSGSGALNIQGSNRISMLQQASPHFMNMLGSSYPTPGGTLSQNQALARGNSSLGSSGILHDGNSSDIPPFDVDDFPQLTGRPNSAGGGQGQYGSLRKQGVSVNAIVQQNQEFSIQNEDFPALPGYKGSSSDYVELPHKDHLHESVNSMQAQHYPMGRSSGFNLVGSYPPRQQHQQSANSVQNTVLENVGLRPASSPSPSNSGPSEQLLQQYHQQQTQNSFKLQTFSGPQSYKDQSLKSVQGTQSVTDPYGLLGLLNVIRLKDPGPTSLALGIDLTTLGLNLNSQDNLYKTFGSPWSNEPAKGEPDYQIPACFSAEQSSALQPLHFQKFHPLTLFYIFYSMPKDVAQLYAANELYSKGWFYHKDYRVWLTRPPNVAPLVKTPIYERGSYICFDANIWDTVQKDNIVIQYESIRKPPEVISACQNVR